MSDLLTNVLPQALRLLAVYLLWLYSILLLMGWLVHRLVGDTIWWLALASSLLPLCFLPLLFFLLISLWVRQPGYWVGLLLPSILFLYLYGPLFIPKRPPAYAMQAPTLRLMTFNLWAGSYRAKTAEIILDSGLPDIVALQELSPRMQRLMLKLVGHAYPYSAYDTLVGNRGLGIFSRYPLERLPISDLLIDLNCRQYQVSVDSSRRFRLYNCHPRSTHVFYFEGGLAMMAKQVQETFRLRTLLSQHLVQDIQTHGEPTLVVGDFNTTDQSEAYANLRTVLFDVHRAIGWGFGHTFPSGTGLFRQIPIIERQVRIDMVFYTADFVALQSVVGTEHGESDHLPLIATLGWRHALP